METNIYETVARATGTQVPNYDANAGIHYGVISQNEVNTDALDDIFTHGEDLNYQDAVDDVKESLRSALSDYLFSYKLDDAVESAWEAVEQDFNDGYERESSNYRYEADGYVLQTDSSNDIFIVKSPYYTMSRECSPCAPNAGYCTSEGSMKTYCLGLNWFDDYKAPYKVWSVESNKRVIPKTEYRLVNARDHNLQPYARMNDFKALHPTPEAVDEYAKSLGLAEWEVWPTKTQAEVTDEEAAAWDKTQ